MTAIVRALFAVLLVCCSLQAQVFTCTQCTKVDGFPALILDSASNQIGYTSHTLVCTAGTTTCTVTGNITFDAYVQGTTNPNCATNTWSCQGANMNTDSWTRDDTGGGTFVYLTNCTASTSQSNSHPHTWNCSGQPPGNTGSFDCMIKSAQGTNCEWAQITVTFYCQ